ncbi:hypothetical protein H8D29_06540 [PVC group bacterium]|nr:hypothetical protein [PVC group bacterium]
MNTVTLTKKECEHLADALQEWSDEVGAKELNEDEVGLDSDRYEELMHRLQECINCATD